MGKISYFNLDEKEQGEILDNCSDKLNIKNNLLEKDIWLCFILDIIFKIPQKHPMAFKGGTSLSKVFDAINRFSEDIDITLDYRAFEPESNIFSMNNSRVKLYIERLKLKVKEYRDNVIVPEIKKSLKDIKSESEVSVDDSGEKIWIDYKKASLDDSSNYVKDKILIELGGRNTIDPNNSHKISPYISKLNLEGLLLPNAKVVVLDPKRTFWEKATLIHVECNRGIRQNAERLSRHWYDLVKLYEDKGEHKIGENAISDIELLKEVVRHKSKFFNSSYSNYNDCLKNNFKLMPDELGILSLKKDFQEMKEANMIYDDEYLNFEYILNKIEEIQNKINSL